MAKKNSSKPQFQAVFTSLEMEKAETTAQAFGVTRRVALAILTQSSDELLAPMDDATGDALLEAVESIRKYVNWRKDETRLLKAAEARLLVTLQWQTEHGTLRVGANG